MGPRETVSFVSLRPSPKANRDEGKQNSLFAVGPVIKCFVFPPNSKNRTNYISDQGVEIRLV